MPVHEEQVAPPTGHVVQFYDDIEDLAASVARFVTEAIDCRGVAIVVAEPAHRAAFSVRLRAAGVDVPAAEARGDLIVLDAAATMARFMVDDRPDPGRFDAVIGAVVREAAAPGRPVAVYGEMVALLWDGGLITAAIELEDLWNDLGRRVPMSLFCGYAAASVGDPALGDAFNQVCRLHSAVVLPPAATGGRRTPAAWAREASRVFARDDRGPGLARGFVVDTLRRWGWDDVVDDAAVVVTELATNAVEHARSSFTVTVTSDGDRVRIAVVDASSVAPVARTAERFDSSGRGLAMVGHLAAVWATEILGDGKVVWAELGR